MDRLRVFLGESGVVELPGLEDPCQHIEDETIHGTHGRNRRAPLLGSGYEVSDAHFLQESGLIEPRSFFSDVEPEILSVPSNPEEIEEVSTFEDNPCLTWNGVMNEAGGGESGRENLPVLKFLREPRRLYVVLNQRNDPSRYLCAGGGGAEEEATFLPVRDLFL
ncbi:unnamed protein product [Cuscuta campestris]|uniref:Uncharacterized protein n=1 Tax=Cuscuta campestris TaxID=132261 RepID=A0A484L3K8_9ASTE|nr:unnamed protein product [Cuscuta campestris]